MQDALRRNDLDVLAAAIEPDPADTKAARTKAEFIVRAYAPDGIVSLRTLAEFDAAMAGEGPIHQQMPDAAAGFLCDWVSPPVGDLYVEKTPGNGAARALRQGEGRLSHRHGHKKKPALARSLPTGSCHIPSIPNETGSDAEADPSCRLDRRRRDPKRKLDDQQNVRRAGAGELDRRPGHRR